MSSTIKNKSSDYVHLGKIVGVWGVRGWVKLHSYTRNRIEVGDYEKWYLLPPRTELQVSKFVETNVLNCRVQGQGIAAELADIDDRDQAQALIGHEIYVPLSELPELPDNEYYWQQLIGLKVVDKQQQSIGVVDSLLETGANDVLVVEPLEEASNEEEVSDKEQESNKQVLIPYVPEVVLDVDLENGIMIADWDPSFLD